MRGLDSLREASLGGSVASTEEVAWPIETRGRGRARALYVHSPAMRQTGGLSAIPQAPPLLCR